MYFKDQYAFLSNFYQLKFPVATHCIDYNIYNVEAAYQLEKTFFCAMYYKERFEYVQKFSTCSPTQAKQLGKKLSSRKDFNKEAWYRESLPLMTALVQQKFDADDELRLKLYCVEGEIVEDNDWGDTFWGRCNGVGENHLGKILMKVRDEMKCCVRQD